jgi:hypothetical protein
VTARDGALFASDGDSNWQLLADVFGTLWHRVPQVPTESVATANASNVAIDSLGKVTWNGMNHAFADLAESSSFAWDGQTLAVTLPTSYYVFLVAQAKT